jgi:V/A-type H+-transporting ATPase subunit E
MRGLDKIIEKITNDAKAEADKYTTSADAQIAELKDEAVDNIVKMGEEYAEKADKMSKDIVSRAQSSAKMAYRNTLLQKKTEIISLAFDKTAEKIYSLPRNEYVGFMKDALIFAVRDRKKAKEEILALYGEEEAELDSGYEIIFGKKDAKSGVAKEIFDLAKKSLSDIQKLTLSEKTSDIDGGFILKCNDIETNCSVDSMVEEARKKCENKVIEILF